MSSPKRVTPKRTSAASSAAEAAAAENAKKKFCDRLVLPKGLPSNLTDGQTDAQIEKNSKKIFDKVCPFCESCVATPGMSFLQGSCKDGSFVKPGVFKVRRLPRTFLSELFGAVMSHSVVSKLVKLGILTSQHAREVCALMVVGQALPPSNLTFLANNKSCTKAASVPKPDVDQHFVCGLGFLTEEAVKCFKHQHDSKPDKKPGDFEKDLLNPICWHCDCFVKEHPEVKVIPLGRRGPANAATVVPNLRDHPTPRKASQLLKVAKPCGPQQLFHPPIDPPVATPDNTAGEDGVARCASDGTPIFYDSDAASDK